MRGLTLLILAGLGCTDPKVDPIGTYALVAFRGQPLPASYTEGTEQRTVLSGEFELSAPGSWSYRHDWRVTVNGGPVSLFHEDDGTFVQNGPGLTLINPRIFRGDSYPCTIDGNAITCEIRGDQYRYLRQ